jgi:tetratricopeptide (TPR) repeat protein
MRPLTILLVFLLCLGGWAFAEQQPASPSAQDQSSSRTDLDRDKEAKESSSRDTRIDIAPPKDDAKNHPNSGVTVSEAGKAATAADAAPSDVQEFHPWNPHRANKDVEVGDFYFKRKNYRAALTRYQDALVWKDNDAVANFRLGECYEKLDQPDDAVTHYEAYLKILPHGPLSHDAEKALQRLKAAGQKSEAGPTSPLKP